MRYANMLYSEIVEEFDKCKNREQRLGILKEYGSTNRWFKEFLNYAFNPKIHFDIHKIPTYKPSTDPAGLSYATLNNEMRRLYIFIMGHPKRAGKMDAKREERVLGLLLSSLHKGEADLLVKLLKKNLEVRYLTASLVKEAFPDLPFTVEVPVETPVAPVVVPEMEKAPVLRSNVGTKSRTRVSAEKNPVE